MVHKASRFRKNLKLARENSLKVGEQRAQSKSWIKQAGPTQAPLMKSGTKISPRPSPAPQYVGHLHRGSLGGRRGIRNPGRESVAPW